MTQVALGEAVPTRQPGYGAESNDATPGFSAFLSPEDDDRWLAHIRNYASDLP